MDVVVLPLVWPDTPVAGALDLLKIHRRAGVVRQDPADSYRLLVAGDLLRARAAGFTVMEQVQGGRAVRGQATLVQAEVNGRAVMRTGVGLPSPHVRNPTGPLRSIDERLVVHVQLKPDPSGDPGSCIDDGSMYTCKGAVHAHANLCRTPIANATQRSSALGDCTGHLRQSANAQRTYTFACGANPRMSAGRIVTRYPVQGFVRVR